MEMFQRILKTAVEGGASDVHLKIGTPVIFRINRQLVAIDCPHPTQDWMNKIVENVTPPHLRQRIDEEREADFSYFIPTIGRFRTNLFQQRGQWCLAMRYVKTHVPSFQELGLLEQIKKISESPRGIVLVAGSTGCGKSTTLAAMIEHINANFKKHIITLEDPIEYVFEDNQCVVEQREVGLDTLSFHHALKHVLRQDPDIIMVGEMRDSVSFTAAMSAADTGHLVLSTLHTTNAPQSVSRILDFFKAEEREQIRRQLAGTMQAVICQRMVTAVTEVAGMEGDIVVLTDIFKFTQTGVTEDGKILGELRATGIRPNFSPRLEAAGFKLGAEVYATGMAENPKQRR